MEGTNNYEVLTNFTEKKLFQMKFTPLFDEVKDWYDFIYTVHFAHYEQVRNV